MHADTNREGKTEVKGGEVRKGRGEGEKDVGKKRGVRSWTYTHTRAERRTLTRFSRAETRWRSLVRMASATDEGRSRATAAQEKFQRFLDHRRREEHSQRGEEARSREDPESWEI